LRDADRAFRLSLSDNYIGHLKDGTIAEWLSIHHDSASLNGGFGLGTRSTMVAVAKSGSARKCQPVFAFWILR